MCYFLKVSRLVTLEHQQPPPLEGKQVRRHDLQVVHGGDTTETDHRCRALGMAWPVGTGNQKKTRYEQHPPDEGSGGSTLEASGA